MRLLCDGEGVVMGLGVGFELLERKGRGRGFWLDATLFGIKGDGGGALLHVN